MKKASPLSFRTVPAVDRAARVLKCFSSSQEEMGVSELADRIGVAKGSLHQILMTLCQHGLLTRNASTRKYRLGYTILELGSVLLRGMDFREVARPFLVALAQQTGETSFLGVLDGDRVLIVDREESGQQQLRVAANVGLRMPLFAGSFAKVLLGSLSDDDLDSLLTTHPLPLFTERSVRDVSQYRLEIEAARAREWAVDDGEYLEGVRAICVPVRGLHGRIIAAISVVGFAHRMPDHSLEGLVDLTVRTAGEISARLGGNRGMESPARKRG